MLMVKCKCGSVFTVDGRVLEKDYILCPNCEKTITLKGYVLLSDFQKKLDADGISLHSLPKNAKITVTFDT